MINENCVNLYCREDISLIQNYDKAISDKEQTWDCHHRRETDEGLSLEQLKEQNLYYDRPSNELIFLTHAEHISLHHKEKYTSIETKRKQSEAHKGKVFTEEHRKHLSESIKGKNNPMYGKHHNEEARKKQSDAAKRRWLKYHTEQNRMKELIIHG